MIAKQLIGARAPDQAVVSLLQAAAAHCIAERFAEAADLCAKALELQPTHTEAQFLLGFALSQGPDPGKGEQVLLRYIAVVPMNNAAYRLLGKIRQVKSDNAGAVTWFKKALAINADDASTWNDLGVSLHRSGHFPEAIGALTRTLEIEPSSIIALYNLGAVHFDLEQYAQAETALRACISRDENFFDAYSMLASTLDRLERHHEADRVAREYARRLPVKVKPCGGPHSAGRALLILAPSMCNARTDFIIDERRYETVVAYLPGPGDLSLAAFRQSLPAFDFAFNTVVDPDRGAPFMQDIAALCALLRQPVLNAPGFKIERTRRDKLPDLLKGIPGVLIPQTQRMTAEELIQLADTDPRFEPPLLIRPVGFHEGRHFSRFNTAAPLRTYIKTTPSPAYYVSRYCDYRNADGNFRKYRFVFVDRKVYPYHLAISDHWIVHYFRTDMARHAWMKTEEEAFLADYRQVFGSALSDTLQAVAEAIDLDFAGLDCSITSDNRLLVFEANAAMLVHLNNSPETFPYKHRYVPRITQAMDDMVQRRLESSAGLDETPI